MLLRLVYQPFCTSTVIVKVQSVLELGQAYDPQLQL